MKARLGMAALIAAGSLAVVPAHAHPGCGVTEVTAEAPHLTDPTEDYEGVVFGNGQAVLPYGDIYREQIDLVAGRLALGADGKYTAYIKLAMLDGTATNAVYYMLWDYENPENPADDAQVRRYVSVNIPRPNGAPQATWGYLDTSGAIGVYTQQGGTTATVDLATGEFAIAVPMDRMGNPQAPATLGGILAESRMLIGARGTGLLSVVDQTDGIPCVEAHV